MKRIPRILVEFNDYVENKGNCMNKMLNIENLGPRIDIDKAATLIAMAMGKDEKVSKNTVYQWMKRGLFPKQLDLPYCAAVWDTQEVLTALKFN